MVRTINLDPINRRRYRCPRGHARWEPWNSHYYYVSCARSWDVDPTFTELVDKKTNTKIHRSDVQHIHNDQQAGRTAN